MWLPIMPLTPFLHVRRKPKNYHTTGGTWDERSNLEPCFDALEGKGSEVDKKPRDEIDHLEVSLEATAC